MKKEKKKSKKKTQLDEKQMEALDKLHKKTTESLEESQATAHRLPALISSPTPGSVSSMGWVGGGGGYLSLD